MQTLKLIEENNLNIPYQLGSEAGFPGADGQVFNLIEYPNQVLKISVLFEDFESNLEDKYKEIISVLSYIKDNDIPACARIYEIQHVGKFRQAWYVNSSWRDYFLFYYTMEKLNKISVDEKKVFHSVLSHEDRGFAKSYTLKQIKKMVHEMSLFLDFDKEKVMLFCEQVERLPFAHNDIHIRNIMKDEFSNFKLIDFDRCQLRS